LLFNTWYHRIMRLIRVPEQLGFRAARKQDLLAFAVASCRSGPPSQMVLDFRMCDWSTILSCSARSQTALGARPFDGRPPRQSLNHAAPSARTLLARATGSNNSFLVYPLRLLASGPRTIDHG
jgi:hypothetical protein